MMQHPLGFLKNYTVHFVIEYYWNIEYLKHNNILCFMRKQS